MKIQYVLKDDLMTFPESTRFDTVHDFETVVTHTDHIEAVEQARAAREPAKPERQASEIEKRAAWALLTDIPVELRRLSGGDCGHVDAANELAYVCRHYIEAYDYAKSIGAIE